jgi:nifR3 family TIM-barrel protein
LKTSDKEDIVGVQLFGNDAYIISEVIKRIDKDFSLIDINMACPANKIIKNSEGGALLKKENFNNARDILTKAVKATCKPITVKTRIGYNENNAVEFCKMVQDCGVSGICIHPRLVTQMYREKANHEITREVKKAVQIPIIASGDIFNANDYNDCLEKSNADGVYIARGSFGNPFIFSLLNNKAYEVTKDLLVKTIIKHIELTEKYLGPHYTIVNMRKHLLWYLSCYTHLFDINMVKTTRNTLNQITSVDVLINLVNSFR